MWVLDAGNSRELLEQLRPHWLDPGGHEVIWCGEGWRSLVSRCHEELLGSYPDYRLLDIKQKWGQLVIRAQPRVFGASDEERRHVELIAERFAAESESTCEWCGRSGSLRDDVPVGKQLLDLTLCDDCLSDLALGPFPSASPPRG